MQPCINVYHNVVIKFSIITLRPLKLAGDIALVKLPLIMNCVSILSIPTLSEKRNGAVYNYNI